MIAISGRFGREKHISETRWRASVNSNLRYVLRTGFELKVRFVVFGISSANVILRFSKTSRVSKSRRAMFHLHHEWEWLLACSEMKAPNKLGRIQPTLGYTSRVNSDQNARCVRNSLHRRM